MCALNACMSWKWSTGIRSSLDACLLSDEEMVTFSEKLEAILQAKSSLRFASGDFVICQTATWPMPEVWKKGKVVALNYRGSDWPNDRADAPYAVLPALILFTHASCTHLNHVPTRIRIRDHMPGDKRDCGAIC